MKTLQETFDEMVNHLRKQNSKSWLVDERDGACAYRSQDGKMCAVGCLIKDEFYDPSLDLEENIVSNPKVRKALCNSGYCTDGKFRKLMESMQFCHDTIAVKEWESNFRIIANDHNLELKPL